MKVIQGFLFVKHIGLTGKKSTKSSKICNFGKILQCWKNLGMLWLQPLLHTHSCLCVSFGEAAIIILKKQEIFYTTNMKSETIIFLFGWTFDWAETGFNKFAHPLSKIHQKYLCQKLELLSTQNRYRGHQGGILKINCTPFKKGYCLIWSLV